MPMEMRFHTQLQTIKIMKISNKLIKKMEALPVGNAYDTNGNCVSCKSSDGTWEKWKYDANRNLVSIKWSDGSWEKLKRDANRNLVSIKCSDGYWEKYEHDANGSLVSSTSSND